MNIILIFVWIWAAMVAMAFWESYSEGRYAYSKRKLGWKLRIGSILVFPAYHFYLFVIMLPLLLALPLVIYGWDLRLFGVLVSAYFSGQIIQDFMWYVVNPAVKLREFWTKFSDYYPWIRIGRRKIIPVGYIVGIAIAVLSWYFLWR